MKFGQQLEEASVPRWGLHNVDYNALKYQIKSHTARDQATAVAIPGQVDMALKRFEDRFYAELSAQHDRAGLFVSSKADEISRRIRHLSGLIQRLTARCSNDEGADGSNGVSNRREDTGPWIKRRRKFAKYQMQATECGNDIKALNRFINAQIIAFRKILKKYRKWTGSTSLQSRFKDIVLSSPKSFTQREFHALQMEHQELLHLVKNAPAVLTTPGNRRSTYDPRHSPQPNWQGFLHARTPSEISTPMGTETVSEPTTYWNEYDYGSDAGDHGEDTYAIYIDPDQSDFPDFTYIKGVVTAPFTKLSGWLQRRGSSDLETQSLLANDQQPFDYFSTRPPQTPTTVDNDATEDEYVSSDEQSLGQDQVAHYSSFARLEDQKLDDYRDTVMARSAIIAFVSAFILLIISGVLVITASGGMNMELGAGVTASSVASLFCACMGLGAVFGREYPLTWVYRLSAWATFAAVAVLNGLLLVVVVSNAGV